MRSISYHSPILFHADRGLSAGNIALIRGTGYALLGSLAIAASAQIEVPMVPIPMTLQSLVILLVAMAFGFWIGTASILAYLLEGALGLPVFAGFHGGLAYMAGPTGGYLVGFVPAVMLASFLGENGWSRHVAPAALAMFLAHVILFSIGLLWLARFTATGNLAVELGFTPFLLGTLVKIVLGSLLISAAWYPLKKRIRAWDDSLGV